MVRKTGYTAKHNDTEALCLDTHQRSYSEKNTPGRKFHEVFNTFSKDFFSADVLSDVIDYSTPMSVPDLSRDDVVLY